MKNFLHPCILLCLLLASIGNPQESQTDQSSEASRKKAPPEAPVEPKVAVTHHSIQVHGKELAYTATAGALPVLGANDKPRAEIFFIAYTKQNEQADRRPVSFAFNGGPGASSVWLNLAAIGPKRIDLGKEGLTLPEFPRLLDNENTWLEYTDLVFIDPVGTGYSRPSPGAELKDFLNVEADAELVGRFIFRYATLYGKWLAPKYLIGESYGTTRAASLSGYLQNKGMLLHGIVLISSVLNFETIRFEQGNPLPYFLYVPSYATVAWYHKKLPPALQAESLEKVAREAERWASGDYRLALAHGDMLAESEREKILARLSDFTGLDRQFLRNHRMRIDSRTFSQALLRNDNRVLGILDGRVTGIAVPEEFFVQDPSVFLTTGPLVTAFHNYVRGVLDYRTDRNYEFLNMEISRDWKWGSGFTYVGGDLKSAMSENKYLKVLMASGWYDLDVAWASQLYELRQLELAPEIRNNIRLLFFPAGHQVYTYLPALEQLTAEAAAFLWPGSR
jgi:carboxypeptidase C (cathepsin A)